jgi:hypothetical protein
VGLAALLLLSSRLRPDPRGLGTHEQLGLPPCTFVVVAGIRCPACGMTTSWAHATRGQFASALRAHVAGTLLAVAAMAGSAWALSVAASGKWLGGKPSEVLILTVGVVAAAAVSGEWIVRLVAG